MKKQIFLLFTLITLLFPTLSSCSDKDVTVTEKEKIEAANLAVVDGFFDALLKQKNAKTVGTYLSDNFVSRTPGIDGKKGMMDFAAKQAKDAPKAGMIEVFHSFAKDNVVVKHYSFGNDPSKGADLLITDFFHIKDGKIVEYWDVVSVIKKKK